MALPHTNCFVVHDSVSFDTKFKVCQAQVRVKIQKLKITRKCDIWECIE